MYYHIVIKTNSKATSNEEKQLNLSEQELRSQFVEPYENDFAIFINGKVIKLNDIENIKILKSNSERTEYQVTNFKAIRPPYSPPLDLSDATSEFLKWAPGYRKINSDKKIIKSRNQSNQVFVVHGHDNEMKETVARTLKNVGLEPIILHEQENLGKTIIEKFESCSENVSFAVVLLSPDDFGYKKDKTPEYAMLRARQNVILELGYFMGKLGRKNVVALNKGGTDLEVPSDILGIAYIPFDPYYGWKLDLAKEIKAAGYNIDFEKL